MRGLDWDDVKVLLAIAAEGSVRDAAAALGVHHSTVSRRLDQFEQQLDVRLFDRTPAGLRVNERGAAVVARGQRVAREMAELERNLSGSDQRLAGRVRLTLPDVMANRLLRDDLGRFCTEYPGVTLELLPTYATLDIGARDADVALRVTEKPPEHLIGRSLGRFAVAAYVRRSGSTRRWIGSRADDAQDARWQQNFCPGSNVALRCVNPETRLGAVRAGIGMGMLPCAVGDACGDLERVPPTVPVDGGQIWLLTHPDLRRAARVRALLDCLKGAFEAHRPALSGMLEPRIARAS